MILCPIVLEYIKIHACPNGCVLYRKEYENLDQCSEYCESHNKVEDNNGDDNDNVNKRCPHDKVL